MPNKKDSKPTIVITDGDYFSPGFIEEKMPRLFEMGEVIKVQTSTREELIGTLSEADAAVIRRVRMTREVFEACPRLLGLVKMGAGVENIDIQAATDNRIIVANSPAVTIAVAEAALLLMMTVSKPLMIMVEVARKGEQPPPEARGTEMYGKTVGIVGFGQIGSHLAKMAKGIGMNVLVYDPYVGSNPEFKFVDLDELLQASDFVSLNCPMNPETYHLIGARELDMMKTTSVLINTSRGGVVDESALVKVLQAGRIRGAGLDVVENEPIQANNPLLNLPNVVVTPHALARTWESITKVCVMIQDAIESILYDGMPDTALNDEIKRKSSTFKNSIK